MKICGWRPWRNAAELVQAGSIGNLAHGATTCNSFRYVSVNYGMSQDRMSVERAKAVVNNYRENGSARVLYDFYWQWKHAACILDRFGWECMAWKG